MCELLGLAFNKPICPGLSFRGFRHRAKRNRDGWGLAAITPTKARITKEAARADFLARLGRFTMAYGAPLPQLRLTRAATRWGSCARDAAGGHRISLNWRMIHLAPRLIDYVVAHEVAHMRHMHHGPRFWAAVEKLYPDYLSARDEMRRMSLLLPEL